MSAETPSTPEIVEPILKEHLAQTEWSLQQLIQQQPQRPAKPAGGAPPAPPPTPEQEAFDEQHRALVKRVENIHLIFRLFHDDPELARVVNTSIQQEMDKENQSRRRLGRLTNAGQRD